MRPYRYPIPKFLTITVGIAVATSYGVTTALAYVGYGSTVVFGVAPAVVGLFWLCFDKFMWRWKILKIIGISDLPDLNGEWKGVVHRMGDSNDHEFTMSIRQTYTNISVRTATENSRSTSWAAAFLVDDTGQNFELLNYWTCKTTRRDSPTEILEDFRGFSHIEIKHSSPVTHLEDYYFTDRNPPTRGRIKLIRKEMDQ